MKNGFTIIELIISISILSVAIIGIFGAFSIVTILTSNSADQLTATYLAQEGMEIVRNIRDTNWLNMDYDCTINPDCITNNNYRWVDDLTPAGKNINPDCSNGCEVDYTTTGFGPVPVNITTGTYLCTNTDGFYYYQLGCQGALQTKFQRKIIINPITDVNQADDHIIKVTVQVSWNEKATILNPYIPADNCNTTGGSSNCVVTEETLYNWYYPNH